MPSDFDRSGLNNFTKTAVLEFFGDNIDQNRVCSPVNMGGMPPEDRAELKLDRPFAFVLTKSDNIPLFIGIVHNP